MDTNEEDTRLTLGVALVAGKDVLSLTSLHETVSGASALALTEGVAVLVNAELVTWTEELVVARGADGSEWVVTVGVWWLESAGQGVGVTLSALWM